jgi:hypothetical protein
MRSFDEVFQRRYGTYCAEMLLKNAEWMAAEEADVTGQLL